MKRPGLWRGTLAVQRRFQDPRRIEIHRVAAPERRQGFDWPGKGCPYGLDSGGVDRPGSRDDGASCYFPANQIAIELGSAQLANLVLLGAFLARAHAMPLELVETTIEQMLVSEGRQRLVATNREALRRGFSAAS